MNLDRVGCRVHIRPAPFAEVGFLRAFSAAGRTEHTLLRKSICSPAFRPQASAADPFRDAKRLRLKAGLQTALFILSGRHSRHERLLMPRTFADHSRAAGSL